MEAGLQLLFVLALALIVNQTFVGRSLGRALVFSPWAVSGVLTSAIWVMLYNSQTGTTRYLADAGLGSYGTSWLSDTSTVFPAAVVADLWRGVPFFAILILADLQSVSEDLLCTLTGGGPAGETTTLPLCIARTSVDVAFVILRFCSIVYLRLSKFGGETK